MKPYLVVFLIFGLCGILSAASPPEEEPAVIKVTIGKATHYCHEPSARLKAILKGPFASEFHHFNLGLRHYYSGDFTNAFLSFQAAAQLGLPDAEYALSIMYATGQGTEKSGSLSRLWLGKATRRPSTEALIEHALATLKSETNTLTRALAAQDLRIAAALGDTNGIAALLSVLDEFSSFDLEYVFPEFRSSAKGSHDFPYELVGIKRIRVLCLETPGKEAIADGLTAESIKTAAELRLRAAGIEIAESGDTKPSVVLHVSVQCLRDQQIPEYAFRIDVKLYDTVSYRLRGAWVAVWSRGTVGLVGAAKLGTVTQFVANIVDDFANEYLKANPKR